jgi:hypothetical protein
MMGTLNVQHPWTDTSGYNPRIDMVLAFHITFRHGSIEFDCHTTFLQHGTKVS